MLLLARAEPCVLHKIKIVIVVLADLLQSIGEFLAAGEQLLETTKAAGHRFTAGVNDSGVGQNQMNQTNMAEVIGHLVDEKRCVTAMYSGIGQKLLTEGLQFLGVNITSSRGIWVHQKLPDDHPA